MGVRVSTCLGTDDDFDTTLGVYTGNAVNALDTVGSNDDACANYHSAVRFNAQEGTTYRIAVAGYLTETGAFELRIERKAPMNGAAIIWGNFQHDSISYANLDGSGGGTIDTGDATVEQTMGLAVDPGANRVWWINLDAETVSYADLDGGGGGDLDMTGATVSGPYGLALDPEAGRLYWANYYGDSIGYVNTDGSGGGTFDTGAATVNQPCGVAVDPVGNRLWWANYDGNSISWANLDGSGGGGDLNVSPAAASYPCAVALDRSNGKIYWTNSDLDTIGSANIAGGGGDTVDTTGTDVDPYYGLAADPIGGKLWWPGNTVDGIASANLSGGGGATLNTGVVDVRYAAYPTLMRSPSPTGKPALGGKTNAGSTLTCEPSGWERDLVESHLFREPSDVEFTWTRNGKPVAGASSAQLKTDQGGSYACVATATNAAGSTEATSAAKKVAGKFSVGKAKLNKKKGTAKLKVTVSGPGKISLSGKGIAKASKNAKKKGAYKLKVKPKGKTAKKLKKKGKAKLKVKVKFTPEGGKASKKSKKVKLARKR